MRVTDLVVEILELIVEGSGRLSLDDVSKRLGVSKNEVSKALEEALNRGLIYRAGSRFKLTVMGESFLEEHRKKALHKMVHRYVDESDVDRVCSWNSHWLRRHRLDRGGLDALKAGIRTLPTRIEEVIPLTALSEGERGRVIYVYGGRGLVRRLMDMGLTPGVEVTIIRKGVLRGPVQIAVRGTSLALGHGVARRVFVRRVS